MLNPTDPRAAPLAPHRRRLAAATLGGGTLYVGPSRRPQLVLQAQIDALEDEVDDGFELVEEFGELD